MKAKGFRQWRSWACAKCGTQTRQRLQPQGLEVEFPIALRAWCITCHVVLSVGGVDGRRRWHCSQCGADFLQNGKGYSKRRKLYVVPKAPPAYTEALISLSDSLAAIMRSFPGEAFNGRLSTLNRAIRYFARNDDDANRSAVAKEVEAGCATPEEIAESVPLPLEHITALCHQLVKQKRSPYEWRPIGYDAHHGARVYGIFRKDAPTLVRPDKYDPFVYSGHHENVAALTDLRDQIREREAKADSKPLPWESRSEAALRVAKQRQAAQSTSAFSFLHGRDAKSQRMKVPN